MDLTLEAHRGGSVVGKRSRPPYYGGAACSHTQRRASRIVADALLSRVNLEGLAANNDGNNGLKNQWLELQLSLPPWQGATTFDCNFGMYVFWQWR